MTAAATTANKDAENSPQTSILTDISDPEHILRRIPMVQGLVCQNKKSGQVSGSWKESRRLMTWQPDWQRYDTQIKVTFLWYALVVMVTIVLDVPQDWTTGSSPCPRRGGDLVTASQSQQVALRKGQASVCSCRVPCLSARLVATVAEQMTVIKMARVDSEGSDVSLECYPTDKTGRHEDDPPS